MAEATPGELRRADHDWLASPVIARIASIIAHRFSLRSPDRDDIEQELRIAAWRKGPTAILSTAWLYQVAAHIALRLRATQRRLAPLDLTDVPGPPVTPDVELLSLLRADVSCLPSEIRAAFELRVLGMSEREIAYRLKVSRGRVRRINEWCQRRFIGRRSRAVRERIKQDL